MQHCKIVEQGDQGGQRLGFVDFNLAVLQSIQSIAKWTEKALLF